jgi:Ca2+-binding RTX toxin-like protein
MIGADYSFLTTASLAADVRSGYSAGGRGGDVPYGQRGSDRLRGNAGLDVLNGGAGADVCRRGRGGAILISC